MVLKKFTEDYREIFLEMSREFFSSNSVFCDLKNPDDEYFNITFNQVIKASPLCDGYIIFKDLHPCGYINLSFSWNNDLKGKVMWLEEIYIRPEFQGFGIGTKVIEYIEFLYKDDVKAIRLEVTDKNAIALKLYQKIGFLPRRYSQFYKIL